MRERVIGQIDRKTERERVREEIDRMRKSIDR